MAIVSIKDQIDGFFNENYKDFSRKCVDAVIEFRAEAEPMTNKELEEQIEGIIDYEVSDLTATLKTKLGAGLENDDIAEELNRLIDARADIDVNSMTVNIYETFDFDDLRKDED